jgi:hypothetical protein
MTSRAAAPAGAALLLALLAPTASAATLTPLSPCTRYVESRPPLPTLGLRTDGWAPGAALTFKVGGKVVGMGTTDASGAFATTGAQFAPPAPDGNFQTTTLTAEDGAGGVVSSPLNVVRLAIDVPAKARPTTRVRYRVFGFRPNAKLYLFIRRAGKVKGRFALGRPQGECGRLIKRMRYMPLRSWTTGRYEYWASNDARFSTQTAVPVFTIDITRR